MLILPSPAGSKLYVSQIIDNLPDLAQIFGADTETIVNQAQRHFKSEHRRNEWLTVRAMLRQALGSDVQIEYNASGKPRLSRKAEISDDTEAGNDRTPATQEPHEVSLSISHSKTHVALLLANSSQAGVDIERIHPRILTLASRILQPDEMPPDYSSMSDKDKATYLTSVWTIKEAVYKSVSSQNNFDLLSDTRITPLCVSNLPTLVSVKIKGETNLSYVYCQEYCGNIVSAKVG